MGHGYETPNGEDKESDIAKTYLAGSYKFTVDELEVYKIIWIISKLLMSFK